MGLPQARAAPRRYMRSDGALVIFGFQSPFVPCSECGESVARTEADAHVCEQERWLDYQLFQLRDEMQGLEAEVSAYLRSPEGRFELWCAERERARRRGFPPAA